MTSAAAPSPVSLHATFAVVDGHLQIGVDLLNAGTAPILVFDRLWTLKSGKVVADTEPAYRFVRDGKLQLLLGVAPLPRLMLPTFRNVTEATEVEAGGRLSKQFEVPVPIEEYNVYFDTPASDAVVAAKTKSVELLMEYVEATGVLTQPSVSLPGALSVKTPEAVDRRKLVRSAAAALELDVLTRSDAFERPF
jgi:hypothetical protein